MVANCNEPVPSNSCELDENDAVPSNDPVNELTTEEAVIVCTFSEFSEASEPLTMSLRQLGIYYLLSMMFIN